jgi:hypothetical protein
MLHHHVIRFITIVNDEKNPRIKLVIKILKIGFVIQGH